MYHYVVTDWSSALAGFLVSTLLVFPPANPSHINVFLSRFPFFFSTEILCDEIQKWNVKSSIEVQDSVMLNYFNYYVEFVSQSIIVYSAACYCDLLSVCCKSRRPMPIY